GEGGGEVDRRHESWQIRNAGQVGAISRGEDDLVDNEAFGVREDDLQLPGRAGRRHLCHFGPGPTMNGRRVETRGEPVLEREPPDLPEPLRYGGLAPPGAGAPASVGPRR